jgi:hypothetical protein
MAYDARRQRTVLYGGYVGTNTPLSDTWEWDGNQWLLIAQQCPPGGRYGHTMAFHRQRGKVVLVGGSGNSGGLRDAWAYDGTAWTLLPTSGLIGLFSAASMAYSASENSLIALNAETGPGSNPNQLIQLKLLAPPTIENPPADSAVCRMSSVTISVSPTSAGTLTYQWHRNTTPIPNANESTYTITNATYADAGEYTCEISNGCGSVASEPATVTVLPDLVADGAIDTIDLVFFLARFGTAGETPADINGDGVVNTLDLTKFLAAFGRGCQVPRRSGL